MIIHGKYLDDTLVVAAREDFENNAKIRGAKGRLTFDQILDRCMLDRSLLVNIAQEHGVTPQRMTSIYNRYIRGLRPDLRTARIRRDACCCGPTLARDFPADSILAYVAQEANRFGYETRRVQTQYEQERDSRASVFRKYWIEIRGKLCFVTHCRSAVARKGSSRRYCEFSSSPHESCEFRIIVRDVFDYPRALFIFPVSLFPPGKKYYYLPLEKPTEVYLNHHPLIDWWQYEGAFHLIPA